MANYVTNQSPLGPYAFNPTPGMNPYLTKPVFDVGRVDIPRLSGIGPGFDRASATSGRFTAGPSVGYGPGGFEVGFGFTWKI